MAGLLDASLQSDPKVYFAHKQKMDSIFQKIQSERLNPLKQFQESNRKFFGDDPSTVYYPFSGADLINFFSFFPNAKSYNMFGLENVVLSKDSKFYYALSRLSKDQQTQTLKSISTLSSFLGELNYFTYRLMKKEMEASPISGIVNVLLAMISRFGFIIEDVIVEENRVQILFSKRDSIGIRILEYRKIFLNGEVDLQTKEFFLKSKKIGVITKSAEYLFHAEKNSQVRTLLLDRAQIVIQDDSGFPFDSFPESAWDRKLFGVYTGPSRLSGVFPPLEQNNWKEIFKKEAMPLPFPFGYGVLRGKNQSNLGIFKRK